MKYAQNYIYIRKKTVFVQTNLWANEESTQISQANLFHEPYPQSAHTQTMMNI